ncbi:DUF2785 domain-containing protein [Bacillus spongiae]|uniref:DUF2785 domain-containing protein n=1 Tax=Bacillus spongiae TaxID=2683610 RepID=A0ABU8H8B7_9BACI
MGEILQLKKQLKQLKEENNRSYAENELNELLDKMLTNIGCVDSELRDHLIYGMFCKLIMGDNLNSEQLNYILETCLGENYLLYKIGEKQGDSVFTRSFSSLVIALLLEKDRLSPFLSEGIGRKAIHESIAYLMKEKDIRGYVEEKGWAHSVAHGADLLQQAILHPLFDLNKSSDCFYAIETCLLKPNVYTDDEDERLIFVIEAMLEKGVSENSLQYWISSLSEILEEIHVNEDYLSFYKKKVNVISFMKSLYFRLNRRNFSNKTLQIIEEVIETWHQKCYQ